MQKVLLAVALALSQESTRVRARQKIAVHMGGVRRPVCVFCRLG